MFSHPTHFKGTKPNFYWLSFFDSCQSTKFSLNSAVPKFNLHTQFPSLPPTYSGGVHGLDVVSCYQTLPFQSMVTSAGGSCPGGLKSAAFRSSCSGHGRDRRWNFIAALLHGACREGDRLAPRLVCLWFSPISP